MWENEASFGSGFEVGDILKRRSGEGWELVSAMINPSSLIYAMFLNCRITIILQFHLPPKSVNT